ncbi:hypothetical protein AK812_SmicGene44620 [Symbiodinium microadriaticum]|uniref:Uncharacterized protein n=1 Tax=Symbiodinium microadriaticum TaxID=2951 RepID=A0A1Q9BY03_SYMMI|nr:hypothetical protein AK812_SmicGene44620 [Symbiodinium microadriaticum]
MAMLCTMVALLERQEYRRHQKALLEDFLNSYLLAEPGRLPSIRKHKGHCLLNASASGPDSSEMEVLILLCKRYGILGRDPDSSLDGALEALAAEADEAPPKMSPVVAMDTGEALKTPLNVDTMETQPMDFYDRQCLQTVATPCKNAAASAITAPQSREPGSDGNRQASQAAEAAKDLKEQGDDEDLVELQRKIVAAARKDATDKKLSKLQKKAEKASGSVKKDGANKAPKAKAKGKSKAKASQPKHTEPEIEAVAEPQGEAAAEPEGEAAAKPEGEAAVEPSASAQPEIAAASRPWEEVVP